ncbi:hypothetical protein EWM64_g2969 [Hericium alpestre]|uniref:DNA-(apurinic or apyrimidinic site) lyase n=1 Tax=Hericium alpestre TaxID=135208 RepID=A0A4Z0A2S0_9AGAM|nr:hypothetical protein EWM64_g2969 [Hericium alpestre]
MPPVPPHDECLRETETLTWMRDYFQLDIDLVKLYDEWGERDPVFVSFRSRFEGIRMLRQDPWENLVSFICSSNNNIARITKMVKSLCKQYSPLLVSLAIPRPEVGGLSTPPLDAYEAAEQEMEEFHPFPPPSCLADPEKTARMLLDAHGSHPSCSGEEAPEAWLRTLRILPTADARTELLKLMGVGRKVADCILLMSLDKKEVIPVDTHVYQIATKHYGMRSSSGSGSKQAMTPKLYDEVNAKLLGVWGDCAGWAHSVLFTADLKSFASYGLPTPSRIPAKRSSPVISGGDTLPSPPVTSLPSKKRKLSKKSTLAHHRTLPDASSNIIPDHIVDETGSLAERVKRRRRGA